MRNRENIRVTGIAFFLLSLVIVFFSQITILPSIASFSTLVTVPLSEMILNIKSQSPFSQKPDQKLLATIQQDISDKEAQQEMQALRDQFETEEISSQELLPVRVVGYRGYIPGVKEPTSLIIRVGSNQGAIIGQAVVYENNLVGRIVKTSAFLSEVQLLNDSELTFTAETVSNQTAGVIRGGASQIVFGNVVLSDTLEKGDTVVTKGDMTIEGSGFPPNIIVGEITATEKRQSDLFQLAEVESLINVSDLTTVFVYK